MASPGLGLARGSAVLESSLSAQVLCCVLAHAVEQVEAVVAEAAHEALVDQGLHEIDHRRSARGRVHADNRASGFEGKTTLKDGQTRQRCPFHFAQQIPGPIERCPQGRLSVASPGARKEHVETVLHAGK